MCWSVASTASVGSVQPYCLITLAKDLDQLIGTTLKIFIIAVALSRQAGHLQRLLDRSQDTGRLIHLLSSQDVFSSEYAVNRGERPVRQWDMADGQIQETLSAIERSPRYCLVETTAVGDDTMRRYVRAA